MLRELLAGPGLWRGRPQPAHVSAEALEAACGQLPRKPGVSLEAPQPRARFTPCSANLGGEAAAGLPLASSLAPANNSLALRPVALPGAVP